MSFKRLRVVLTLLRKSPPKLFTQTCRCRERHSVLEDGYCASGGEYKNRLILPSFDEEGYCNFLRPAHMTRTSGLRI